MFSHTAPALFLAVLRLSNSVLAAPASTDFIELEPGFELGSQGYLVPSNIDPKTFYEGASFLQAIEPVNRDSNKTVDDELARRTLGLNPDALDARARPKTNIRLGRVYSDYGCGMNVASIRKFLGDGVYAICKGGICDGGKSFTKKVKWLNNGDTQLHDRWITMTPSGAQRYGGSPAMLGAIHDAVCALVQHDIVHYATRTWRGTWTGVGGKCTMAKYPNYIAIFKDVRDRNKEPWSDTSFDIRMSNNKDRCENSAVSLLGGLVGEIPGGSSLMGLVNVLCTT